MVVWAGGRIFRPEFCTALVGLGLEPRLGVGLLVGQFPRIPRLVTLGLFLPVVVFPWEYFAG